MTATMITTTTSEARLRLRTWLSPAFPTGAFAYSHGIEWAVEAGDITDAPTLHDWLDTLIVCGSVRCDAILLRHAWRTTDLDALCDLADLAAAIAPCRERQLETLAQGAAFCAAAAPWPCAPLAALQQRRGDRIAYPVAVGVLAACHGIDPDETCEAFLHGVIANLVSAGVRLIPLGQNAGLRVLAALEQPVLMLAGESCRATLDDLGGACLRADIAAMRHETQYTRLFRS